MYRNPALAQAKRRLEELDYFRLSYMEDSSSSSVSRISDADGSDDDQSNEENEQISSSSKDRVCQICTNLAADYKLINPVELQASARSKTCVGCMQIMEALRQMNVDVSSLDYSTDLAISASPLFLVNQDGSCKITAGELDIEMYASEREPTPFFGHLTHGTDVSGDTASVATIERVKKWMEECTVGHLNRNMDCCPLNVNVPLPQRLLDVRSVDGPAGTGSIRLVETGGRRGMYACLTHCWGSTPLLRTQNCDGTYKAHLAGIPLHTLPKSFRDAVKVAHDLSIPYIWIDSLCIIQDDEADWRTQSALMASIYQNGRITIAAAKSDDSTGGCFADTSAFVSKELVVVDVAGETHYARARLFPEHGGWPSLERAWILQERLLSPRVLHFGHAEVVWECLGRLTCECARASVSDFQRLDFMLGKKKLADQWTISHNHLAPVKSTGREFWAGEWRTIVESYSRLNLSYRKDLFTALSGAAKQMRHHRNSRYLAGMWEDSLMEDLLWDGADPWRPRPLKWQSPTWSWAIVSGGSGKGSTYVPGASYTSLRLWGTVRMAYTTLQDVSIRYVGPDDTAEIESASITLAGPSLLARLERPDDLHKVVLVDAQGDGMDFGRCSNFSADYNLRAAGHGHVADYTPLICLKVAFLSREEDAIEETRKGEEVFIVLRESPTVAGVYERIGLYSYSVDGLDPHKHLELATTVTIV